MSQHMPPLWQGAPLSGVPIIYLQPCELSFLGIQLKVSLKWSPLVHPYQTPLSWHFHFRLSELSALLCWLRLCQGSGLSLVLKKECWPSWMLAFLNADLPAWLFWAAGITVGTVASGLVVPHWGECIGKCWNLCIFWCGNSSFISCWGHQGTRGTLSVWGRRSLLWPSGKRELRFIHTH